MSTNGTISNGITAVGVKDKFLSLKWDPVESATSYAIYKEVRDMWDMQTIAEDCKETLGALRPGNKVLIRIVAIDSSGAKVGVLGPAEFLTTGPVDDRQFPFNNTKLDANWKEILGNYPEPAAKADPYSGANPCPFGTSCTLLDNYAHCVDYNHPRPLVCPNGPGCLMLANKVHISQFTH